MFVFLMMPTLYPDGKVYWRRLNLKRSLEWTSESEYFERFNFFCRHNHNIYRPRAQRGVKRAHSVNSVFRQNLEGSQWLFCGLPTTKKIGVD